MRVRVLQNLTWAHRGCQIERKVAMMLVIMKLVVLLLMSATSSVATAAEAEFLCPAAGNFEKPMLDALNDAVCDHETFAFTKLVTDYTVIPSCTMYCASCEAGDCLRSSRTVTCSNSSLSAGCTLCADPPGCGDTSSSRTASDSSSTGNSPSQNTCSMLVIGAMMIFVVWFPYCTAF